MTAAAEGPDDTGPDDLDELRAATEDKARADRRWHDLLHRDWHKPDTNRSAVADAAGLNRQTAYSHMKDCKHHGADDPANADA